MKFSRLARWLLFLWLKVGLRKGAKPMIFHSLERRKHHENEQTGTLELVQQ